MPGGYAYGAEIRTSNGLSLSMYASGPVSVVARALRSGGGLKFLIVAIDYFTKWIEAKAVATITGNQKPLYQPKFGNATHSHLREVNIATNDDERRIDLDILEERREQAAIREEKAKLKMKGILVAKSSGVSFRPGDSMYSCLMTQATLKTQGSLGTKVGRTLRGYGRHWER
ncbi:hypothetical protein Tco_0385378 [Tanacetum coccineum]